MFVIHRQPRKNDIQAIGVLGGKPNSQVCNIDLNDIIDYSLTFPIEPLYALIAPNQNTVRRVIRWGSIICYLLQPHLEFRISYDA